MARSRDISKVLSSSTALATDIEVAATNFYAGKNKIINGDFSIWQRGTSFTTGSSSTYQYTVDRWQQFHYGTNTASCTQQTFTPGSAPVSGYEGIVFARFNSTNTANFFSYRVEDVRTLAGQTATLSFWAKSNSNQNLSVGINQNFGSGGSSSVTNIISGTASLTTSWQRFSFSGTISSVSGKTIGSSSYVYIEFVGAINNAIDIWGAQLEAGSTATVFIPAGGGSQQAELALCQRYFIRFNESVGFIGGAAGNSNNSTLGRVFPVVMRAAPTMSHQNTRTTDYYSAGGTNSALTSWHVQPHCAFVVPVHGNLYGGGRQVVYLESSGGTSYVEYAIEL
jgi:hypothetical protein